MPKIKNKNYRAFMDTGIIELITEEQIITALGNVRGNFVSEGRALICVAYLTGARPSEYLRLKGKDIKKEKSYVVVFMEGTKRGKARIIHLQYKNQLARELYKYSRGVFPEAYLFYNYRSSSPKEIVIEKKDGTRQVKKYDEETAKLRHHFKTWFKHVEGGINPYFLRHNRFSSLAQEGVNNESLKQLKGSKTLDSIEAYKHMSAKTSKDLARKIK